MEPVAPPENPNPKQIPPASPPQTPNPTTPPSQIPPSNGTKKHQKLWMIISIVIITLLLTTSIVAGFVIYKNLQEKTESTPEQTACTLEAKICPDGSSVGRTGPNCEFAECPTDSQKDQFLENSNLQPTTGPTIPTD